ncbi:MAG: protein arginine kinase [Parachlamydiaceae bacterium]|nr:protein arginine kinase [Parachlamydiaceae bacterium]
MSEKHPNHLICNKKPWKDDNESIWLGSIITLNRNLEKFNFPSKLSPDKRKQIISLVGKDLLANKLLKNPKIIKGEEISAVEKEFLVEHFLSPQSFQQVQTGEAFVLDDSGEFLGLFNLYDHISLKWIDCKEDLENAWARLVEIEGELNKTVNFAFSPKFGFLTSDPTQCGTALIVDVFLHLPGLIYSDLLDVTINKYKEEGILQTGLQGDPNEIIGDIVSFHNAYTLGVTEENILTSLRTLTMKILVEEKSIRSHIKHEKPSAMKDKVSRAYAILLHSYQIEAIEALNAISLLKLALDLEWVTGVDHRALNELLFDCRRSHLLCQYESKISLEEIPHKRSEYIHNVLKNATLHI